MSGPHDAGSTLETPVDAVPGTSVGGSAEPVGTTAPHRRLVAVMLLVVALGALGLVALGAAADRGPGPVYRGSTEQSIPENSQRNDYSEPDWATGEAPTTPPRADGPNAGMVVVLAVLGAALLLAAMWVAYRMWKLARPPLAIAGLPEEDELTADQARAALEDARTSLSTVVDAHDAVIAAWLALERAIAAAGVRRHPSQTTLEFVVAVLGDLELDRSALDRLAHLYRRALFDAQPLVESDRDQALVLLDDLTEQLESGSR